MIYSMTGYATRSFALFGQKYKIELKSLNHRFLELKLRTPREWNSFEQGLRTLIEGKVKRGSVELWVEINSGAKNSTEYTLNMPQADAAREMFLQLKTRFHLADEFTFRDLLTFPDVLIKGAGVSLTEDQTAELQKTLEKEVALAVADLIVMRGQEGMKLQAALLTIIDQFKTIHGKLIGARLQIQKRAQDKIKKRIEQCFEAYATPDAQMRALMETRIAQEISYAMDKLDIEEELTRFEGHLGQIEKVLKQDEAVGKKLDFLFQELNREINTLGNKAQDLEVSQEVIQMKMWVEQMREQSLNLE